MNTLKGQNGDDEKRKWNDEDRDDENENEDDEDDKDDKDEGSAFKVYCNPLNTHWESIDWHWVNQGNGISYEKLKRQIELNVSKWYYILSFCYIIVIQVFNCHLPLNYYWFVDRNQHWRGWQM